MEGKLFGVLRQGTRIEGEEEWRFPITALEKKQQETVQKAGKKLSKPPKKRKPVKHKIGTRETRKNEFDILKVKGNDVKISCEIDEFMKEEDILKDIREVDEHLSNGQKEAQNASWKRAALKYFRNKKV